MKSLSVRNIPDDIYKALKNLAKLNHRSLQEQVRYLLAMQVRLISPSPLAEAKNWRNKLKNRMLGNTIDDIREDRKQ